MTITFRYDSLAEATRTWNRLQRGEKIYWTKEEFYGGRMVYWPIVRASDLRYVSFDPVLVRMDIESGPAVTFR